MTARLDSLHDHEITTRSRGRKRAVGGTDLPRDQRRPGPARRARCTKAASGSVQNTSTTRNRAAAISKVPRSPPTQWPKKPIPTAPPPAR